jgi:two-component system, OmpR family, sensor kinase
LPIRAKLTVAFGLAMLLMLSGAALFVYLRLQADLDERIEATLRARVAVLVDAPGEPSLTDVALEDPEETFVQLLSSDGAVLGSVGTVRGPALVPDEVRRAGRDAVTGERILPGVDGPARLFAHADVSDRSRIVVVGQSLVDRNDELANVVSSFALGGAAATLLASGIGYLLATLAFAPVEAMRRRASEVSLRQPDQRLPLPGARDEIHRLGETLNEMLARLRDAFERESRFVADASHELRTPIAVVKAELEAALRVTGDGSPAHPSLVAASEECDRLIQLAEDLLVLTRAADGQLPVRPVPTGVTELLCGVQERFADRAARRGRVIRTAAEDLRVCADPVRLRQALSNLVDNALRHGTGDVSLAARNSGEFVEIDVSDEGAGFPAEISARAFDRFSRGARARTGDGVGLGLAIVAAIAAAHGGSAEIAGGAPTTLRLRLPAIG